MYCIRPIEPGLLRRSPFWGVAMLLCTCSAFAQTVAVSPPRLVDGDGTFASALFRPAETAQLNWTPAAPGMQLKIGDSPGTYARVSISVSDLTSVEFTPNQLGLAVGVYHANITNAPTQQTYRDIRNAANSDRSIVFSQDFLLVVESPVAPTILGPRGTIFSSTPTFEWEGIPGVAAYVLAVSSTPFELRTDPQTNDPVVEGLTPVWGALTTETSARYGQASQDSPFPNLPAPPLEPGREYYFTVVNTYSKSDLALISEAFGGVVAFRYDAFTGLLPPNLITPREGTRFLGDASIRFAWEPVIDAASYTFTLTERQVIGGSIGDVPVFTTTTPSTEITLDASRLMRRGTYTWSVIPNEADGAAGLSSNRAFSYEVPMGQFRFRPRSTADDTAILGVRVEVENLDGRHAPIVPLVNSTESYRDSLVTGRYLFHASRDQYADTTYAITISANQLNEFVLGMRPLPARVSGLVLDDSAGLLENAAVAVLRGDDPIRQTLTDSEGRWSVSVPPGTYSIRGTKDGFATDEIERLQVEPNEQVDAPDLILEAIAGFVSGRVVNEDGQPVQLATVVASFGSSSQRYTTDGQGGFDFTLAAGSWTLTASKAGFLGGQPVQVQVSTAEHQTNVTVVLTEQASQVSGSVFGVSTGSDGVRERRSLAGALVIARPYAGPVLTTVADNNGQFILDVGAGSYFVTARADGFMDASPAALRVGYAESVSGLDMNLVAAEGRVTGRVVDPAGLAVGGATLLLGPYSAFPRRVTASPDGRFDLALTDGVHEFVASAAGHGSKAVNFGLSSQLSGLQVILVPAASTVSGVVTRAGATIPFATVVATTTQQSITSRTDQFGRYSVGLSPGSWSVRMGAEGHESSAPLLRTLLAGQALQGLDADLIAAETTLRGVVTSAGKPVGAAVVSVMGGQLDRFTVVRADGQFALPVQPGALLDVAVMAVGFRPYQNTQSSLGIRETRTTTVELLPGSSSLSGVARHASGVPLAGVTVASGAASATSQFDGAYTLFLDPGTREVQASLAGYATTSRSVTLALGEQRSGVDFQLTTVSGQLIVTVQTSEGTPIQGAAGDLRSGSIRFTSSSDLLGQIRYTNLAPGTYELLVQAPGFTPLQDAAITLGQGETRDHPAVLASATGSITGRVLDTSNASIPGAVITGSSNGLESLTLSSNSGQFELMGLMSGSSTVSIARAGYAALTIPNVSVSDGAVTALGDVVLLPRLGSLTGLVTSAADGRALAGVQVTLVGEPGAASTESNDLGQYSFSALATGLYEMEILQSGFRKLVQSVTIAEGGVLDVELAASDGRILGVVIDKSGAPLGFPVRVVASGGGRVVTVTSGDNGNYTVTGLDPGASWTLRTEINRPGYVNGSNTAAFSDGVTDVADVALIVAVNTAEIGGNAGFPRATVRLLDGTSGEVRGITSSLTDGGYAFALLASGGYRVVPEKEGVSFSPAFRSVVVAQGGSGTASFTAVAQVGTIRVQLLNVLRQPMSAVDVVLSSEDGLVVRPGRTDIAGVFTFEGLPLLRTYTVRPSLAGFSSTPPAATVLLEGSAILTLEFTLAEATGQISGTVRSETGTSLDGQVTAVEGTTGIVYQTESVAGAYTLEQLPGGLYNLTATAQGFRMGEQQVVLAEGEAREGLAFSLRPATVLLQGRVVYRGAGTPGVLVRAQARSLLETVTDAQGAFIFPAMPLDVPAPDTTVYTLSVLPDEGPPVIRTVRIPGERLGQVVTLDDIALPSGRITVSLTDGLLPIDAAQVTVESSGGRLVEGFTDVEGLFETPATLGAGPYRLDVVKQGYLGPSGPSLEPTLTGDSDELTVSLALPYRHVPAGVVSSIQETEILVLATDGHDLTSVSGTLTYTLRGASESLPLIASGGYLKATLPAANGAESIIYEMSVTDGGTGLGYASAPITLIPQTPGKLATLRIEPALAGSRLRAGDTYQVRAVLLDGIGTDLRARFLGGTEGKMTWALGGDHASLVFPDPSNPTEALLTVQEAEAVRLEVTATLGAADFTFVADFQVQAEPLSALTLASPLPSVSNSGPGIQMNYRARLEDGSQQLLGNGLSWSVSPPSAGRVTESGVFVPGDRSLIGPIRLDVTDPISEKSAFTTLSLYRDLLSGEPAFLRGARGGELSLPGGAIPFASEIGLSYPPLIGPKRNASSGSQRLTVGDALVRFSMRSDRALPGDSLLGDASVQLSADPSLALFQGERVMARFETDRLRWRLLKTEDSGGAFVSPSVRHLTEFAILATNETLGLRNVAVLPSPFSPNVAPLRIGYLLTSQEPSASVTIRVFNMQAQLVKTILQSELQEPGRYGSGTSRREILWDGTTDGGTRARNGRYIIRIEASDTSGTTTAQISAVLVK
ncbi:MAG: hypothetical protein ACI9W4_000139 [Rhodothermales bacterium]